MKNRIHIFVAAASIAMATVAPMGAESTTANSMEGASKPEPVRARQICGVRCRLRAQKYQWQASETPEFKTYIFGQGNQDLWLATRVDQRFQIQVDGQWYGYTGPEWIGGVSSHGQTQWIAKVGGYLGV